MRVLLLALALLAACPGSHPDTGDLAPAADRPGERLPLADAAWSDTPRDRGSSEAQAPFSFTVEDDLIAVDTQMMVTPSTWNAHLPKLVSDGSWSYAVFTRYTPEVAGRVAWIYRRGPAAGATWSLGRTVNFVHQPPGLALTAKGTLYLVFDCAPNSNCTSGGAGAGASTRFYALGFSSKKPDGSIELGDSYANHNEWTAESFGYMGIGVHPTSGEAWSSLAVSGNSTTRSDFTQRLFRLGAATPPVPGPIAIPKLSGAAANSLYPQLAFSPGGVLHLGVSEAVAGWTASAQYSHTALYRIAGGAPELRFSDSVASPDGSSRWIFGSDLCFTNPGGRLRYLYYKVPSSGGHCNYLVREQADGSLAPPIGVGCHGSYAQLQCDAKGGLTLLRAGKGAELAFSRSTDDGASWSQHTASLAKAAPGTASIADPTLLKPWSSPAGYQPNVLHGFYAGMNAAGLSWYAGSFRIHLAP